jgi:Peptidase C10 family
MSKKLFYAILACCLLFAASALAQEIPQQNTSGPEPPEGVKPAIKDTRPLVKILDKEISGVPGYQWRHGCGPTAVGMILGYYDGNGFPDIISGDASTQTSAVDQAIASEDTSLNPQHYEDYSLPDDSGQPSPLNDKSEAPAGDEHTNNCVADFMRTSWSSEGNYYGWSFSNMIGPAFQNYVSLASSYSASSTDYYPSTMTWSILTTEIDNDRPMILLVDTDGDGYTDHFVTATGYRTSSGYQEYGCLDTWSPYDTVRWERFRPMASGDAWGIWGGTTISISDPSGVDDWMVY